MTWSLARMSRFVAHSKFLENLKNNDDLCSSVFKDGKFLLFSKDKPLLKLCVKSKALSLNFNSYNDAKSCCDEIEQNSALVSIVEDSEKTPLFSCSVKDENPLVFESTKLFDMRAAIMSLPQKDASIVARGFTLLKWLAKMKYCSTCANLLVRNAAGTMLTCNSCNFHNYPITHPVAITRVENHAGDSVLLVRQPRHPVGMYSCIAGFLESGESLEDAVRREIAEEAGIVVGKVNYFDSQTWPLPQNSLMLACVTTAMPGSEILDIDKNELEDAKWFTKDEIKEFYDRTVNSPGLLRKNDQNLIFIPPKGAIAHDLLKNWIQS